MLTTLPYDAENEIFARYSDSAEFGQDSAFMAAWHSLFDTQTQVQTADQTNVQSLPGAASHTATSGLTSLDWMWIGVGVIALVGLVGGVWVITKVMAHPVAGAAIKAKLLSAAGLAPAAV
jgi:hypothetical protein